MTESMKVFGSTALVIAAAALVAPAAADPVADFYKDKTVKIVVAAGPGGNHSKYSLLLSPFWKKYVPGNPTFVIQNMGGAGGTKAANYLYNSAPQDGSYIGILLSDTPLAARVRATGVKYDPSKFHYLGGADYTRSMITVLKTTGARTLDDAKKPGLICGSSGKGSQTYYIPMLTNYFFGTKFKVVTGYRGMNPVDAAMDRGETNCRAGVYASIMAIRPHWISQGLVVNLAAATEERIPAAPETPTLFELTNDQTAKDVLGVFLSGGVIGRAWLAPPRVPADRVAALRAAFWKAFNDPEVAAAMKKRKMARSPVRWQAQQKAVERIMKADKRIFDIANRALGGKR